jgi:glycine dehydrogenase subunit 2
VLNNNYLLKKVLEIRGVSAPYAQGKRRIEQVRYSWEQLTQETGVHSEEIESRVADFGMHYWTSHHPYVVPEPMTLEPTESYPKPIGRVPPCSTLPMKPYGPKSSRRPTQQHRS